MIPYERKTMFENKMFHIAVEDTTPADPTKTPTSVKDDFKELALYTGKGVLLLIIAAGVVHAASEIAINQLS
jgi:hypothetical protein